MIIRGRPHRPRRTCDYPQKTSLSAEDVWNIELTVRGGRVEHRTHRPRRRCDYEWRNSLSAEHHIIRGGTRRLRRTCGEDGRDAPRRDLSRRPEAGAIPMTHRAPPVACEG